MGSWRRGLERHGQRSARAGSLRGNVGCRLVLDVRELRAQQAVDVLAATAAASVMHVSGNPGARASHALIGLGQEAMAVAGRSTRRLSQRSERRGLVEQLLDRLTRDMSDRPDLSTSHL